METERPSGEGMSDRAIKVAEQFMEPMQRGCDAVDELAKAIDAAFPGYDELVACAEAVNLARLDMLTSKDMENGRSLDELQDLAEAAMSAIAKGKP